MDGLILKQKAMLISVCITAALLMAMFGIYRKEDEEILIRDFFQIGEKHTCHFIPVMNIQFWICATQAVLFPLSAKSASNMIDLIFDLTVSS